MEPEAAEITWTEEGIEVIYSPEVEWDLMKPRGVIR